MSAAHLGFPTETVVVFVVMAVGAMFIDLFMHRHDKPISLKSAAMWSLFWVMMAMAFAGFLYVHHGAEMASLFLTGYALEEVLSVDNLFVMMAISILVFTLIYLIPGFDTDNTLLRILIRLPVLPLLFGLGYEFIRYAGTHDNVLIRALSQPGLWMQRLTTKEPDESEIEVAIMSLKLSLLEEFPKAEEEARAAMHTKEGEADGKSAEDGTEQEKEKEQDSVAPTDGEV